MVYVYYGSFNSDHTDNSSFFYLFFLSVQCPDLGREKVYTGGGS